MKNYFLLILLCLLSNSCNKPTIRTNNEDGLEISKLIVINDELFNELTNNVLSSNCFLRNNTDRKIIDMSFQNVCIDDNESVDFIVSLLQYSYIFDQEDLKGIYGGLWIKHNKDSLLFIINAENLPKKLFKKSNNFINIRKYEGGPIGMSDIVWLFRYSDEKLKLVSEQCNSQE